MGVTWQEAREWGTRDGERAVRLAREKSGFEGVIEEIQLPDLWPDQPPPDAPGRPARLFCEDWISVDETGGVLAAVSREAALIIQEHGFGDIWEVYWDALELAILRSNVRLLTTHWDDPTKAGPSRMALYVVDLNRFPDPMPVRGFWDEEDGTFKIDEADIHKAFKAREAKPQSRLRRLFRRA